MTDLPHATVRQLWLRGRIKLSIWAMRCARRLADFSEWIMPEDLKRGL
ncbi:MAG: hypothetical protein ACR65X_10310 [Methylocystis sp.]